MNDNFPTGNFQKQIEWLRRQIICIKADCCDGGVNIYTTSLSLEGDREVTMAEKNLSFLSDTGTFLASVTGGTNNHYFKLTSTGPSLQYFDGAVKSSVVATVTTLDLAYVDGTGTSALSIKGTGIDLTLGASKDLRINSDPGTNGQLMVSQGPNLPPVWSTVSSPANSNYAIADLVADNARVHTWAGFNLTENFTTGTKFLTFINGAASNTVSDSSSGHGTSVTNGTSTSGLLIVPGLSQLNFVSGGDTAQMTASSAGVSINLAGNTSLLINASAGAVGEVLTSQGSTTAPIWTALPASGSDNVSFIAFGTDYSITDGAGTLSTPIINWAYSDLTVTNPRTHTIDALVTYNFGANNQVKNFTTGGIDFDAIDGTEVNGFTFHSGQTFISTGITGGDSTSLNMIAGATNLTHTQAGGRVKSLSFQLNSVEMYSVLAGSSSRMKLVTEEIAQILVTDGANTSEIVVDTSTINLKFTNTDLRLDGSAGLTGQVPTSQGPGNAPVWQDVQQQRIIVTQANFATTLGSGTIDSTKEYFLDGIIDVGTTSIEIPSGGIYISGYNFDISGLISTANSFTLFTSPVGGSGNVLFMDFLIDISGTSSQVYDIVGDTGFEAIEIDRINFNNCTSLGEIDTYRQGLETGTGRFGGTPNLILSGTWVGGYFIDTSIVRSLTDGAYALFEEGTAFVMSSRFRTNMNVDLNATVAFVDFAPANFANANTLQLTGCIATRNGVVDSNDVTLIPNMASTDIEALWKANVGLPNTFVGGALINTVEAATVITVAGTFVDLAGTYVASGLSHFDSPANGQLRHLGNTPKEFKVFVNAVLDSTSGDEIDLKVVVWDDSASAFVDYKTLRRVVNNLQGGRNVAFFTYSTNILLDTNDYVKFQAANVSATNNITAELDSECSVEER